MSAQPFRNPAGGLIDRTRSLAFTFNGRRLNGYAGDTLASALLANGVRLVGRSFKYHRPRGIFAAGVEEPNALVGLGSGARAEPNLRATQIELFDGLVAASQNCWPSVRFDLGAINGLLAPLLPAGFYYKTFKWPAALWEPVYERVIRMAAGLGRSPRERDPDHYDQCYAFCDVLVVGGGPAGLAAALAAGRTGARIMLVDDRAAFGGSLRQAGGEVEGRPPREWVSGVLDELSAMPEAMLLPRTTAIGYYDHNMVALCERVADHLPEPPPHRPRQRLWRVRAKEVVLATGAVERGMIFADNDRPGVMLASAARAYANEYAVRAGQRAVVFTNNDSAYAAARDLAAAGIEIAAVVDVRAEAGAPMPQGVERLGAHAVVRALGRSRVSGALVAPLKNGAALGRVREIECDLVGVSGGWNPTVHLHAQARGRPVYDERVAAFVPGQPWQRERPAGAANGTFILAACLAEGFEAGAAAAAEAGFDRTRIGNAPAAAPEGEPAPIRPLWSVPLPPGRRRKRFVDQQNDVTAEDIALAAREGYSSVEHLKRYTTLGMGTDQGRTSNVEGLAILAGILGRDIPSVGTTTFRPPFAPVTLGALAGRELGQHFAPILRTPIHSWHEAAGAVFVNAGPWRRAAYYPRAGEDMWEAIFREARAVRNGVGMVDVSTLGKIDIQGADAVELLNRVYVNGWSQLAVGRCRYGVMLREDGIVFDDGTTSRLGAQHYLMTTTTGNATQVLRHLEYLVQVVWPELDVHLVAVTDEWATVALAGPRSRDLLGRIADIDVGGDALPFMAVRSGTVAGIPRARIFRISFSGELAYEIAVPADYGLHLWLALLEAGRDFGLVPYGTEAMNILRVEKGHVTGGELNGRTSADDLGFGHMLSGHKPFIGRRSLARPALVDERRRQLVGLVATDGRTRIPRGAQLVADPDRPAPNPMEGEVTATCYSPNLEKPIGLALLARGRARIGERLYACSPLARQIVAVEVAHPVFFDPEGERLRG